LGGAEENMSPITYGILIVFLILSLVVIQAVPIPADMKPYLLVVPFMIVMFMWLMVQANMKKKKR
jgi:hypothetical protein